MSRKSFEEAIWPTKRHFNRFLQMDISDSEAWRIMIRNEEEDAKRASEERAAFEKFVRENPSFDARQKQGEKDCAEKDLRKSGQWFEEFEKVDAFRDLGMERIVHKAVTILRGPQWIDKTWYVSIGHNLALWKLAGCTRPGCSEADLARIREFNKRR